MKNILSVAFVFGFAGAALAAPATVTWGPEALLIAHKASLPVIKSETNADIYAARTSLAVAKSSKENHATVTVESTGRKIDVSVEVKGDTTVIDMAKANLKNWGPEEMLLAHKVAGATLEKEYGGAVYKAIDAIKIVKGKKNNSALITATSKGRSYSAHCHVHGATELDCH